MPRPPSPLRPVCTFVPLKGSLSEPTLLNPVTLVAGATDAHRAQSVLFSDPPGVTGISHPPTFFHDDCAIQSQSGGGSVAVCTQAFSVDGAVSTASVLTEAASAIAIQIAQPTGGADGSGNGAGAGKAGVKALVGAGLVAGSVGLLLNVLV